MASLRLKIISTIEAVAGEHKRPLVPLTDATILLDSGLDSLALAVIVARLEDELDVDPFSISSSADFPATVGDLITAYERAVKTVAVNIAPP